jgi:hypothetical protein
MRNGSNQRGETSFAPLPFYLGNLSKLIAIVPPGLFPQRFVLKALKYSAAVVGEDDLRMRHTPCGYTKCPFGFQPWSAQKSHAARSVIYRFECACF